jgi:hypothetical protein
MDLYFALLLTLVIGAVGSIAFGIAVAALERRSARADRRPLVGVAPDARVPTSASDRSAA